MNMIVGCVFSIAKSWLNLAEWERLSIFAVVKTNVLCDKNLLSLQAHASVPKAESPHFVMQMVCGENMMP